MTSFTTSLRRQFAHKAFALRTRRRTSVALAFVAAHLALWVLVAMCTVIAWRYNRVVGALLYVPAAFYLGSRLRALGNMTHECSHSTFTATTKHNWLLGNFLSFFDFTCFADYRTDHLSHHRFLGHRERDLDYRPRRHLFENRRGSMLRTHILAPLSLRHVVSYIRPVLWSRSDSIALAVGRQSFNLGLLAFAHFVVGWPAFVAFYLVPYAATYQIFRYWSDALDHAGIAENEEEIDRSRNHVPSSRLLGHVLFPRNDAYHLVHHIYPALPTAALGTMHEILLADPRYAAQEHRLAPLMQMPASRSAAAHAKAA